MNILQAIVHYAIHLLLPLIVAVNWYQETWKKAWMIMLSFMLIDLDHLWANPVFDPNRCSMGFHPLHQPPFIALGILLLFFRKTRLIGLGLTIHYLADSVDCLFILS